MANANAPHGLSVVRTFSSGPEAFAVRRYKKEASVILAPGDPVVLTGSSEAVTGIPLITRATGSEGSPTTITGVVVAIDVNRNDLTKKHFAAADTGYVLVCDDPLALFNVIDDGVSDTLVVTDIGQGGDLVVANANTTIGKSVVMVDTSTIGTDAQVQLMEVVQKPNNAIEDYCQLLVRINEHTYHAAGTLI